MREFNEYLKVLELDKSPQTIRTYKNAIDKFLAFFSIDTVEDVSKVTYLECYKYQEYLKQSGLQESSANTHVACIKAFLSFLSRYHGLRKGVWAVEKLKEAQKQVKILTDDEITSIFGACKRLKDKAIIAVLISTGVRREELANLKISDVRYDALDIHGKGKRERPVFLWPDAAEILAKYLDYRIKKYGNKYPNVFITKWGRPYNGGGIYERVKAICEDAGISPDRLDEISTHKFRHTAATRMWENTHDLLAVQTALGHASSKTTERYTHPSDQSIKNSMMKSAMEIK
jgi:site-specific recombinase XerD